MLTLSDTFVIRNKDVMYICDSEYNKRQPSLTSYSTVREHSNTFTDESEILFDASSKTKRTFQVKHYMHTHSFALFIKFIYIIVITP